MKLFQVIKKNWLLALPLIVVLIFFYKTVIFGQIPFPGDLLVGHYQPYASYPYAGYNPGSFPNKGQDFDVLTLLYPDKEFAIESLKHGVIPLWDPYVFAGNPHLATLQSGTFYLFNIVFFILPHISAWTVYILLQPILACLFTFLYLRELKLSSKSSIFGGIVFAFSSYSIVWMEYGNLLHTILWLPIALFLCQKIIAHKKLIYSILLSFALSLSILAGYIQLSIYVFIFSFLFFIYNVVFIQRTDRLRRIVRIIPFFILPLFLSAIQLAPSIELFANSARSAYVAADFPKLLIPLYHAVTLFAADFFGNPATKNYWLNGTYIERVSYIGVVPLFFLIYSFFGKKAKMFRFFLISAIVTLVISFDTFISRFIFSFNIPVISTTIPTRAMFIFTFSASVLAAMGMDNLTFEKESSRKALKAMLILGFVYIFLWGFVIFAPNIIKNYPWVVNLAVSKRNLILPSVIFFLTCLLFAISYKVKKIRSYLFFFLLFLTIVDLFYFFQKITPFSKTDTIYPQTELTAKLRSIQGIDRYWGYGSGYIESNIPVHESIYSADGYNALYIKRYGEFILTSKNGAIPNYIPRSNAVIAGGYGTQDLRNNPYRQQILNVLGVKYVLNRIDGGTADVDYQTFPQEIYSPVWQKGPWQIYQNNDALERIFLASGYIIEKDEQGIINKIFDKKIDLSKTLILEERLPDNFSPESGSSTLKLISYQPSRIVVNTNSAVDKLLFISDSYFPGWRATVDGKEEKIYRADYTFRAVPVRAGSHTVEMYYDPQSFKLGLIISGASLVCLLLLLVYSLMIVKKNEKN